MLAAVPIIIGVGDVKNASLNLDDAIEPLDLIVKAIRLAAADSKARESGIGQLLPKIDSIAIVRTWTWPYADLPGLVAHKLDANPRYKHYTEHGGNQPAKLIDEAARQLSKRESKIAVVAGGEALASRAYKPST